MFETTLRYNNPNNKDPIETQTNYYDSLVLHSHLLAYSKKTVPLRLRNLIVDHDVEYYIDPISADFRAGDDFRKGDDLKQWHQRYVDTLGEPLTTILEENANADASQFDPVELRDVSESVVDFQETYVERMVDEHADKYEDFDVDLRPKAITPWYHKIQNSSDVSPNRTILEASQEAADLPLKPCLYVTKQFLRDVTNRNSLADLVEGFDIDECFLWVDDMSKHTTSERQYKNVLDLVTRLREAEVATHFYYGDYFAYVAGYFGAGGTTHGTIYGEEKAEKLESSGSGGLLNRYFVDTVKDFLKIPAAVQVQQVANEDICECEYCQRHLDNWPDLIEIEESDRNLQTTLSKHHIATKWRYTLELQNTEFDETLDMLSTDYNNIAPIYNRARQVSPDKELDYLMKWVNAARSLEDDAEDMLNDVPLQRI